MFIKNLLLMSAGFSLYYFPKQFHKLKQDYVFPNNPINPKNHGSDFLSMPRRRIIHLYNLRIK